MAGLSKALLTSWRLIMGPGGPGGPAGPGRLSPSWPASPWKTSLRYSVSGNTKCSKLQKLQNVCACGISAMSHICTGCTFCPGSPLFPFGPCGWHTVRHSLVSISHCFVLNPILWPFYLSLYSLYQPDRFPFSCLSTNTGHGAFGSRLTWRNH